MPEPGVFRVTKTITPEVSEADRQRARFRAEYFATHAAAITTVQAFRRAVLALALLHAQFSAAATNATALGVVSGEEDYATVSPDMARAFLHSPALALLEVEEIADLGISVIDVLEDSSLMDFAHDGETVRFTLRIAPHHREPIEPSFTVPASSIVPTHPRSDLASTPLRRGSVLDELHWLGQRLSEQFPWDPRDATWFVLTGEPPMRPLVELTCDVTESEDPPYSQARISLSVDATLSPDEVANHYARVRDQLLGGVGIRRAEARTLEVFRFVTARRVHHPGSTWGDLVRQWDQTAPEEWGFGGDEKAFQVYWRRGFRSVFPEFRSAHEGEPATADQV
jgi:hypothetical protein